MSHLKLSLPLIPIGLVLLLSGGSLRAQPSNPHPEKHEVPADKHPDSASQNNQEGALYVAIIQALNAITHQEKAAAEETRANNKSLITPFRIQEGLLIVGIAYTFFAWLQWKAIRKGAIQTAEISASQSRAFLFAQQVGAFWEKRPDGKYNWRLRPYWFNSGQTATKNLRLFAWCEIRDERLPTNHKFEITADMGHGLIPPHSGSFGGAVPMWPLAAITPEDIEASQRGEKFIYLWGVSKYFDIFPNTPERTTHFCWFIVCTGDANGYVPNAPGKPPDLGTLLFNNIQHTEGNFSD